MNAVLADITTLTVDAIVNAAAPALLGGGGVDGAIHEAAGPRLLEACREIPQVKPRVRCPTGEARITPGFDLRAKWVIHTVGPVYTREDAKACEEELASCYRACLRLVGDRKLASVAFPAISTGAYGFPAAAAARIAVKTVRAAVSTMNPAPTVVFACFDEGMLELYERELAAR